MTNAGHIVGGFIIALLFCGCAPPPSVYHRAASVPVVLRAHPMVWADIALRHDCPDAIDILAWDWPPAPSPAEPPGQIYSALVNERLPGGVECVRAALTADEIEIARQWPPTPTPQPGV